jgi:glycosyltransferase involved in cell wall biosynthesis
MKKVLIIAYYWPPSGGSGVQRWLKFAKYLHLYGWQPIIVTPKHGTAPYYDETLLADVHVDTIVYKTATLEPFALYNMLQLKKKDAPVPVGMIGIKDSKKFYHKLSSWIRANLFVPDARKGWVPYAIKGAEKAISEHNIAAIVTTGPPHSTHLAGLALKKKYNIPWLADLRDPWTNIYYNKTLPRTSATKAKDLKLETKVLQTADAVSVVSYGMEEEFKDRAKNIYVVFNGYDEQDIPAIYDQPTEKFELCHVGNFFPYMDVPALWQTLASLCAQRDDFRRVLRLNFTGLLDPVVHRNIVEAGLGEHLYLPGAVNHKKATETMAKANLLLFVIPNIENNALVVTGKIFEYLACRSEILPIGNVNSNVAGILRHCNANQMVDYNDGAAMQKIIIDAFKNWLNNKGKSPKSLSTSVENYSRRALTRSISDILNQIAS